MRWSRYLWPGTPLPDWPADMLPPGRAEHPWRVPLLATAAGSAVVSGTLYGLAALSHARYEDPATPRGQLDGLRSRNNGLLVGSAGAGGLALGAAAGAAWTFR